jgi:hypothetical protein
MSYDLAVLFAVDEFPLEQWLSLSAEIGETADLTRPNDDPRLGLQHWRTTVDVSAVFATLYTLNHPNVYGVSEAFRWRLGVYANSGCSAAARWAQFSIPHRCISLFDSALAYDPQSDTTFDSPDEYWVFASNAVTRWPGLPRELRRLGLLDENGCLAIDRPPTT